MDRITCHRCQGFMYPIDPFDSLHARRRGEGDRIRAWRCLSCGDLIDPVDHAESPASEEAARGRAISAPSHFQSFGFVMAWVGLVIPRPSSRNRSQPVAYRCHCDHVGGELESIQESCGYRFDS